MREVTALGAAIAAGLSVGIWEDIKGLESIGLGKTTVFSPKISDGKREQMISLWEKAVQKSLGWKTNDS